MAHVYECTCCTASTRTYKFTYLVFGLLTLRDETCILLHLRLNSRYKVFIDSPIDPMTYKLIYFYKFKIILLN